jgi:hypothetical protein
VWADDAVQIGDCRMSAEPGRKMPTQAIWSTPQPIFDAVAREFNITIDLCTPGASRV